MITLSLTNDEVNYIGRVLGKQPYEEVSALISNLLKQISEQQKNESAS